MDPRQGVLSTLQRPGTIFMILFILNKDGRGQEDLELSDTLPISPGHLQHQS